MMISALIGDTLVCDTTKIALWKSDPAFRYDDELTTSSPNLLEWIMEKIQKFLQYVLGGVFNEKNTWIFIIVGVLIIGVIVWFVIYKHPSLFVRKRKDKLDYSLEEDNIYGIDFDAEIKKALAAADYRAVVRLLYLQTLKMLSDEGRIDWQLYKTPTQYIREMKTPSFTLMTNHFLRIRYGNFKATKAIVEEMEGLQAEVEKGGAI
jgi:hypothetical protein